MSEQRAQATTGAGDDPQRTRALDVGDGATVDLQKPDDGPWRTVPLDATSLPGVSVGTGAGAASAGSAPVTAAPRPEPTRPEPTRPEPTRPAPASSGPARAARPEPARPEPGRDDTAQTSSSRPAAPDGDAPRTTPAARSTVPRPGSGPERVQRSAAPTGGGGGAVRSRRARLRVARIDPWSVLLLSLLVSLFLAVVVVVAVVALYAVLEAAGVPDSINALVAEVTRTPGEAEPEPLLSAGRALRAAGVIAVVDVVLLTALATLSAVLYNLCASFTGGLEVTLAEDA